MHTDIDKSNVTVLSDQNDDRDYIGTGRREGPFRGIPSTDRNRTSIIF